MILIRSQFSLSAYRLGKPDAFHGVGFFFTFPRRVSPYSFLWVGYVFLIRYMEYVRRKTY